MKVKNIKEYGFYQDKTDKDTIIEAFADEDNGKEVLSIMIWKWFKTENGVRFYETDMFALNPLNEDICNINVVKSGIGFKIVDDNDKYYSLYGASSVMYEYTLSDVEKLDEIVKLCDVASRELKTSIDSVGNIVWSPTDKAVLASKILSIING